MNQTGTVYLDLLQKEAYAVLKPTFFDSNEHTLHYTIEFPRAYETPPVVVLSITGLYAGSGSSTRLCVEPTDITPISFRIALTVEPDNNTHGLYVAWVAMNS